MSLTLYCGNCCKSVASGSIDELKAVILAKPLICSKCNKKVIENDQALFRDQDKDEVFVNKIVKKIPPTSVPKKACSGGVGFGNLTKAKNKKK
jgi:hypothetical protein